MTTSISTAKGEVLTQIITTSVTFGVPVPLDIPLKGNNTYLITNNVDNGFLKIIDGKYNYIATKIGNDTLSYSIISNGNITNNIEYIFLIHAKNSSPVIFDDSQTGIILRAVVSFIISFGIVFIIYLVLRYLVKQNNKGLGDNSTDLSLKARLLDIVFDEEWHPSLGLFQFTLWTIIVIVTFLGIYIFGILSGYGSLNLTIPDNLLIVMGLSTASGAVGFVLSRRNYSRKPVTRPSTSYPYLDMIKENGKISLTRFQMFCWTFIGIAYYITSIFIKFATPTYDIMSIPDLPETFVILMGISQLSYLTGKYLSKPDDIEIEQFLPAVQQAGERVQIFGKNFQLDLLSQTNVWLTNTATTYIINGNNTDNPITIVNDGRIDVKMPANILPGKYEIMVGQGSIPVRAKDMLEIIAPVPLQLPPTQ